MYLGIKHVTEIVFRPKNSGWVDDFEIRFSKIESAKPTDVKLHRIPWRFDEYYDIFEKYHNIRQSCRNCSYCNGERASDVTLADFWKVKNYDPALWDKRGVSLILANNEKGIRVISELMKYDNFTFIKGNLADKNLINSIFQQYQPQIVVNLGAQAGVRYSIENHDAYVQSNVVGFLNLLECVRSYPVSHYV